VQTMAEGIASNAPLSVKSAKRLVYAAAERSWTEALEEGDRIYESVYLSEDAQEGPRSFREKRPPVWKGR
jgi:enoyl-CoA hydratase/carnithine racemase